MIKCKMKKPYLFVVVYRLKRKARRAGLASKGHYFLTQFLLHLSYPQDTVTAFVSSVISSADIPPSLSCRDKKAAAEGPDEKELKKKEKQRLEKEKKELKERQEREKKEQKEREKKENEMKKKFKVSDVIATGKGGVEHEQAAPEGALYLLAYKPV